MNRDLPIVLDGAEGEGGGQRLRTALALSCCTGRPFSAVRLRAQRPEPGLRAPHVQAVRAAAALCEAEVEGAEVGSQRVTFAPRAAPRPVDGLVLEAGPSGSTGLLLQVACWPLALASGPSTLTLHGATHQPGGPTFHELALVWAPAVGRLGFKVELSLGRAGFHGGGGLVTARVEPAHAMPPLDLRHRGLLRDVEVLALSGGVGPEVADGQASRAVRALRAAGAAAEAERMALPVGGSSGSALLILATFERTRSGHGAVAGREGTGADPVEAAVGAFRAHLGSGGAVDGHLADQLLLPAALLAAGLVPPAPGVVPATRFSVGRVTAHLLDVAAVVERFLDVTVAVFGRVGEPGEVRVQPRGVALDVLPLAREGEPGHGDPRA